MSTRARAAIIEQLPSWRSGATLETIVDFLIAVDDSDPDDRLAVFDNDGTLWCEKPAYPQLALFVDELRKRATDDPSLLERAEYAAVLTDDPRAFGELGIERVASALLELFVGWPPERFTERSREFLFGSGHPTLGRQYSQTTYQPMLELKNALVAHGFTIAIASGGGTEFVRSVSRDLYGVAPEYVIGSFIAYEFGTYADGWDLARTAVVQGAANEGVAKVVNIQQSLGRRPRFAAGNSAGDVEMLDWAASARGPSLAVLVDHDDAEREFAYASVAATLDNDADLGELAARGNWTVVSMERDWARIFPGEAHSG